MALCYVSLGVLHIFLSSSIVTFTEAYVSYVIPKTHYDPLTKTYFVTVTVCLIIPKPTTIDVAVVTDLADVGVPPIQKVCLYGLMNPARVHT